MKQILNALFLTIISLVTFSCSDVPSPYDINEGEGPAGIEGAGTYENPYTVADAIKTQNGNAAWVKGYIVGIMGNKYKPNGDFDGNEAVFTPPFTINTNVLIAATPDETNVKKCLPVKVKNGSDLANAINLVSHPDNLGQPLIIKGKLAAGFGMPSLIETTGAFFDGKLIGEGGGGAPVGTVVVTTDKPYDVSFASSLGDFKVENKLSEGLKGDVWYISTKYTCVTASGYTGTPGVNVPAEGWLLSPILDLTALTKASLTFVQSSYNQGTADELMLKIKESSATDWTDLTIPNYSSKRDDKVTSIVDLTSYGGKKVQIAFVYKTEKTADANTWYIYNLTVAAGEGGGTDPEEPGVAEQIFYESFDGEGGISKKKLADFVGYLDKSLTFSDSGMADIRDLSGNFNLWLPANKSNTVLITGFSTEGYKSLKLTYKIACFTKEVDWKTIKVKCGDKDVTIPDGKTVGGNTFEEVVIENVATGITSVSFISDSENTQGFRIDDIKLEGVK